MLLVFSFPGFSCYYNELVNVRAGRPARGGNRKMTYVEVLNVGTVLNVITFDPKCDKALNVITFGPKCNKPPMQSFNCANIEMLK